MDSQTIQKPSYSAPEPPNDKRGKLFQLLLILALLLVFGAEVGYVIYNKNTGPSDEIIDGTVNVDPDTVVKPVKKDHTIKAFETADEFQAYLAEAGALFDSYGMDGMMRRATTGAVFEESMLVDEPMALSVPEAMPTSGMGGGAGLEKAVVVERSSETNVQVQGIDEPDIVKTDGEDIYFSTSFYKGDDVVSEEKANVKVKIRGYYQGDYVQLTEVIKALPVEDLELRASIEASGNLLLQDDILMIFTYEGIMAYNVSDPSVPVESWVLKYEDKNKYSGARLYGNKLYLITNTYVNQYSSCPIEPYMIGEEKISVSCGEIYHPSSVVAVDTTYNIGVLDIKDGSLLNSVSFVGSSSNSEIYMSVNSIYISYYSTVDLLQVLLGVFESSADLFPAEVVAKLKKVASYDISNESKMVEVESIMEKFIASLDSDEELRIENEMENRMETYIKEHIREFEETGIVKVSVDKLKVMASGFVPGHLLNQFSMDEYKNNLRVATTSGGRGSMISNGYSVNDVYVLDSAMNIIGSAKDMGEEERIYSVRFLSDKGYVVTFRETDPFYVLDLSNPTKPEIKGELKIPGYSSYLHPIDKDTIIGFGKEDGSVKISMFDVSDPADPKEVDKYTLKEYWSDILNTHHAFLMDDKYKIFFVPGNDGGYIFSYADNKIELKKAISGIRAKRAIFINDYLYILGESKVIVLDEKTWERVNEIDFK
jgi:inhibitor of cysteine peptidase